MLRERPGQCVVLLGQLHRRNGANRLAKGAQMHFPRYRRPTALGCRATVSSNGLFTRSMTASMQSLPAVERRFDFPIGIGLSAKDKCGCTLKIAGDQIVEFVPAFKLDRVC